MALLFVELPELGPFPAPLGGLFRALVAYAERFHDPGHGFELPNVATHDVCESGWVKYATFKEIAPNLPRIFVTPANPRYLRRELLEHFRRQRGDFGPSLG